MIESKIVVPGEFAVAPQPMPEDLKRLAKQGYKTLINNRPDNEHPDQPSAATMRAAAEQCGLHYIHIPVTLDNISRSDIDAFHESFKRAQSPVLAHCGTGKRAYLLWAASKALYDDRSVNELVDKAAEIGLEVKELQQIVQKAEAEQTS